MVYINVNASKWKSVSYEKMSHKNTAGYNLSSAKTSFINNYIVDLLSDFQFLQRSSPSNTPRLALPKTHRPSSCSNSCCFCTQTNCEVYQTPQTFRVILVSTISLQLRKTVSRMTFVRKTISVGGHVPNHIDFLGSCSGSSLSHGDT